MPKFSARGKKLHDEVSADLRRTFEGIAKLALQGSAEVSDDSLNVVEKMRKAHTRVTLIVDDAMRGLAEAHESMFVSGIILGATPEEDGEEKSSPH